MQQADGVGIQPAGQERESDSSRMVTGETARDTLRLLLPAALCAGLVAAAISFIILAQDARSELAELAEHNAKLLDGRVRRALELAALEPALELPPGARVLSRVRGSVTGRGAVEIQAVVQLPGREGAAERVLPVTLTRAVLARGLWRDVPRLGKLDLWLLTKEPAGIWDLAGGRDPHSSALDESAFLSGCKIKNHAGLATVQGRLVACAFVPSAALYLLATTDPISFYHATLRRSLTLFLLTGILFLFGVIVAHRGERRYLTSLFTVADALRQDVYRRRESIRHLQQEAIGHADARRIADYGRWVTQLRDGNFYWHEVDDEVARIYGVDRHNLLGALADSPHNLHPEDRARIAAHWEYINIKLFPYMLRYRLVQPGGGVREIIDIGEPRYGFGDEVLGFQGIIQDVTGRRLDISQGMIRPPSRSANAPQA